MSTEMGACRTPHPLGGKNLGYVFLNLECRQIDRREHENGIRI